MANRIITDRCRCPWDSEKPVHLVTCQFHHDWTGTGLAIAAPEQTDEITRPGGLRDQFAMAALNGVWADPVAMQALRAVSKPADDALFEKIASGCWRIADAMLEARKK